MDIPQRFKQILEQNAKLSASVMLVVSDYVSLVGKANMEFFNEYTEHGIPHIEKVLKIADKLIVDESLNCLNATDIAILICSIIIHDLGMYITYEGILYKISEGCLDCKIDYFDDKSWAKVWNEYLEEAKHWGDNRIKNIFGKVIKISVPPKDKEQLTEVDKKLIGEFIRRNHARLAHEFAAYGFPGVNQKISLMDRVDDDIKDLVGVVARSHGINLRNTFQYVKNKYGESGWKTPFSTKIFYLMIVLRIADYLDVEGRAYVGQLKIRTLASPISRREWNLHDAIKYVEIDNNDPESLYVFADPRDSVLYLRLTDFLQELQAEIDTCWAILGEIYGRMDEYSKLKIKIRRVKSNIEEKEYAKKVKYIAKKVIFDSDPEILKLLIAPLYGDNPTFGVRELLQNSIDACRERKTLLVTKNGEKGDGANKYEPKITIEIIENSEATFVIKDNGIGMTEDVLINYFLKAGASYRKNSNWYKLFSDEKSKSIVQRNGRFGVGIFAAFLLGGEMEVTTRHIDSMTGLTFVTSLDTEQIDLRKTECEVGTIIKIKIAKASLGKLRKEISNNYCEYYGNPQWYNWYIFDEPKIEIKIPTDWGEINHDEKKGEDISAGSYTIRPENYNCVQWTFLKRKRLICNGIIIPNGYNLKDYLYPSFRRNTPYVSVTDYDGNLPLTLDRNNLDSDRLPFEEELVTDICCDIVGKSLSMKDITCLKNGQVILEKIEIDHPALEANYWETNSEAELILFKHGYCLCNSYNIQTLGKEKITFLWINQHCEQFENEEIFEDVVLKKNKLNAIADFSNIMDKSVLSIGKDHMINGCRICIPLKRYNYLFEKGKKRLRAGFTKNIQKEFQTSKWVSLTWGNVDNTKCSSEYLDKNYKNFDIMIEYYIDTKPIPKNEGKKELLSPILKKYINSNVIIPYSMEERVNKYKKAFKELDKYMDRLH
ncbi:MAG: ATP-binding protein [Pelosinus sp.]|nr:ATP-binding protein [Pelosinus sp.]